MIVVLLLLMGVQCMFKTQEHLNLQAQVVSQQIKQAKSKANWTVPNQTKPNQKFKQPWESKQLKVFKSINRYLKYSPKWNVSILLSVSSIIFLCLPFCLIIRVTYIVLSIYIYIAQTQSIGEHQSNSLR